VAIAGSRTLQRKGFSLLEYANTAQFILGSSEVDASAGTGDKPPEVMATVLE
jgi:hypothetical protein